MEIAGPENPPLGSRSIRFLGLSDSKGRDEVRDREGRVYAWRDRTQHEININFPLASRTSGNDATFRRQPFSLSDLLQGLFIKDDAVRRAECSPVNAAVCCTALDQRGTRGAPLRTAKNR